MKVSELIKLLEQCNPDIEVEICGERIMKIRKLAEIEESQIGEDGVISIKKIVYLR